jgi:putative ABC transport system permease protein
MAENRTKEIGIRKILGATVTSITSLFAKDFLKLVMIAVAIASPLAWFFMNFFLEQFSYRTNISWWIMFAAGTAALLIALFTISFQSAKAAMANPVKNLRTE